MSHIFRQAVIWPPAERNKDSAVVSRHRDGGLRLSTAQAADRSGSQGRPRRRVACGSKDRVPSMSSIRDSLDAQRTRSPVTTNGCPGM